MKAIKFIEAAQIGTLYNPGEVAGFEDAIADDLIERGIAEEFKESAAEKKAREKAEAAAEEPAA